MSKRLPAIHRDQPTVRKNTYMCNKCGRKHKARHCAAFGKECLICKKANHFAKCCRGQAEKTSKRVYMVEEANSESDILHIQVGKVGRKLLVTINVQADICATTTQLRCQLNTASTWNALRGTDYQKRGRPTMQPKYIDIDNV